MADRVIQVLVNFCFEVCIFFMPNPITQHRLVSVGGELGFYNNSLNLKENSADQQILLCKSCKNKISQVENISIHTTISLDI